MAESIFDYVILALLLAIIFHILLQMFGNKCSREYMGTNKTIEEKRMEDIHPKSTIVEEKTIKPKSIMPVSVKNTEANKETNTEITKPEAMDRETYKRKCRIDEMSESVYKYIGNTNPIKRVKFEDDLDGYQDDFFKFNETVNNSSGDVIDAVDKMNEFQLSDIGNENAKGKRISDIYNGFTNNKSFFDYSPTTYKDISIEGKSLSESNVNVPKQSISDLSGVVKLVEPIVDNYYGTKSYMESSDTGSNYVNYDWRFENDNVNNGGKFYDEIGGFDDDFEGNLSLN